jgi:hypothetical protein
MKNFTKVLFFSFLLTNFSLLAIVRTDVVGYTTNDWQFSGPVYTRCRTDLIANKIHIYWLGSTSSMYNFYNCATHMWNWQNGTSLPFSVTSMDNNPIVGGVLFSGSSSMTPFVVNESIYCYGPIGYRWPIIAISNSQANHIAMINNSTDSLYYSRVQPWCTWSTPILIDNIGFPTHNIAASEISNKVAILWENSDDSFPERAFYRLSNDGGLVWDSIAQIPFPPSQGLTPTYNIASLFAMFDNNDNLRIVASVTDTGYAIPAEIWLYSHANIQPWTLVHHYDAETLNAAVGYNATFACRPSIVQSPTTGYFYVTWEQFDSLNYEPITDRARADIYVAELRDNGHTVYTKQRITIPNTTSKRFPIAGGVFADTLVINYLIDSIAGFSMMGEHVPVNNKVVCQFIPVPFPSAQTEEHSAPQTQHSFLDISPNPFSTHTAIRFSLPVSSNVSLQLYDISGKLVRTLINEHKNSGSYSLKIDNYKLKIPRGIYFCNLKTDNKTIMHKIIKAN